MNPSKRAASQAIRASVVQEKLRTLGSPEAARLAARFFKTGPGDYGEGDVFLGIRVPVLRQLAREVRGLPMSELVLLLQSDVHEDRMLALLVLVLNVAKGDDDTRRQVYELYLAHTRHINNWDLVDASARSIVGGYLADKDRAPLHRLAASDVLWERRIAIVATHEFIVRHDFADTLAIAHKLLKDRHDLIHKAVGWMLREVGKRDQPVLETFLRQHGLAMPRTSLRYAIERFPEPLRREYLERRA